MCQGNPGNSGECGQLMITQVSSVETTKIFQGNILVAAPHIDDDILGCGGTIASLNSKEKIHFIYATDGSKSPAPMFPWQGSITCDLSSIRMKEAYAALEVLGVPGENVHFLGLPDAGLRDHLDELTLSLSTIIRRTKPSWVITPFRYDRHPDHMALNRSTMQALESENCAANVLEYFVYYRWRLLPRGDIRKHIRRDHLFKVDIECYSDKKKKALQCFTSQTTLFFSWQDRPILPENRVTEVSQSPELFLRYNPNYPEWTIFPRLSTWIRLIYHTEPALKKRKDQILALLRSGTANSVNKTD